MNCEWPDCDRPARAADQERRQAQPDDKWMILCEEHDASCGGSVPARNTPKEALLNRQKSREQQTPAQLRELAEARLEYFAAELRVDVAIAGRVYDRNLLPPRFEWMLKLNEMTIRRLLDEVGDMKTHYGRWIYRRDGLAKLREGMAKFQTILGTYQLMASVGANYTGRKEESKQHVVS